MTNKDIKTNDVRWLTNNLAGFACRQFVAPQWMDENAAIGDVFIALPPGVWDESIADYDPFVTEKSTHPNIAYSDHDEISVGRPLRMPGEITSIGQLFNNWLLL